MLLELTPGVIGWDSYAPDASQVLATAGLKDDDVEAMADAMRRRGYASNTSPNDRNLGAAQTRARLGRSRGEDLIGEPLEQLEEEKKGVEEGILDARFGRHRGSWASSLGSSVRMNVAQPDMVLG